MNSETKTYRATPADKKNESKSAFDLLRADLLNKATDQTAAEIKQLRKLLREKENRNG